VTLVVAGNRSEGNTAGSGVFGAPDVDLIALGEGRWSEPITPTVDAFRLGVSYVGNDFRANLIAGVRLFVIGGVPGAQSRAEIQVTATGNHLDCNRDYGLIADSFSPPVAGQYRESSVTLRLEGNDAAGNGRNDILLSPLRFQQAVAVPPPAAILPLVSSRFVADGDVPLDDIDYWNEETSNVVELDGAPLPHDKRVHAIQPAVCPPSRCVP
jgi:hypothetical protein